MTVDNPASETKQRAEERKKCGLEDCYNDDEGLNDVKECMDGEPFLRPRDTCDRIMTSLMRADLDDFDRRLQNGSGPKHSSRIVTGAASQPVAKPVRLHAKGARTARVHPQVST
jgi:hypothetical protein